MAFRFSPAVVTDGLVLYLDAANPRSYPGSGTTWSDLSRGGNNGVLTNGPTFNSANGGSIVFDGTNDYCSFNINASTISNANQLTFSIWYRFTSGGSDASLLEIGGFYNHWSFYWDLADSTGCLSFTITGNYLSRVTATTNTKTGAWFNSCGTFSSNSARIYTNGILQNTRNSLSLLNQTGNLEGRIFSDSGNRIVGGNGSLVQIYNRALTSQEVLQNYNATKSRFGLT